MNGTICDTAGMEPDEEERGAGEEEWLPIHSELNTAITYGKLTESRVYLWALVLEARSLPNRVEGGEPGWQLLVPVHLLETSLEELRLFEEENRYWPPPLPRAPHLTQNTLASLSVLVLLATFHNFTLLDLPLPGGYRPDWLSLGTADAARIRDGEWWRTLTALTLHSDWSHLLGNLTIGGVFIVWLCRDLGSGLAWSLLLSAGFLGNLANAMLQAPQHRSLGASTLVFAAVGILAALTFVRQSLSRRRRRVLPVAAALALLALLGTEGVRTDLGAHLFGFVYGLCLGFVAGWITERFGRPGAAWNAILAAASGGAMVTAWWLALTH